MLFGVGVSCRVLQSIVSYLYVSCTVDQLPRFRKRELICLLSFTCNYVVSVRRGFLEISMKYLCVVQFRPCCQVWRLGPLDLTH